MLEKTVVLAGMVVAAIAVSAPSVASAQWTHGTVPIGESKKVSFSGSFTYTMALGGFSCQVSPVEATLEPGTTGKVEAFTTTLSTCKGTGGFAGCTAVSVVSTNLPWTMHTDTQDIRVTGLHIDTTFTGQFCPYHALELKGTLKLTPDNSHAASLVHLSSPAGELEWFNGTTGQTVAAVSYAGTWAAAPSGTYGIT